MSRKCFPATRDESTADAIDSRARHPCRAPAGCFSTPCWRTARTSPGSRVPDLPAVPVVDRRPAALALRGTPCGALTSAPSFRRRPACVRPRSALSVFACRFSPRSCCPCEPRGRPTRPASGRAASAWCSAAGVPAVPPTSACSRCSSASACRCAGSPAPAWAPSSAGSTRPATPRPRSRPCCRRSTGGTSSPMIRRAPTSPCGARTTPCATCWISASGCATARSSCRAA